KGDGGAVAAAEAGDGVDLELAAGLLLELAGDLEHLAGAAQVAGHALADVDGEQPRGGLLAAEGGEEGGDVLDAGEGGAGAEGGDVRVVGGEPVGAFLDVQELRSQFVVHRASGAGGRGATGGIVNGGVGGGQGRGRGRVGAREVKGRRGTTGSTARL